MADPPRVPSKGSLFPRSGLAWLAETLLAGIEVYVGLFTLLGGVGGCELRFLAPPLGAGAGDADGQKP